MSREIGNFGEDRACDYLKKRGFEIVERNFYSKFGEIDIVAKKGKILHFIEVKYSKKYNPVYAITAKKLTKIVRAIEYYLLKKRFDAMYCIDAVVIKDDKIEFLENITLS